MAEPPDNSLAETRAALAPTLEATAAILPLLARPKPPRFDPALNERWQAACARLSQGWAARHQDGIDGVRSAIFSLLAIALELKDVDILRLSEALASAGDRLEDREPPLRTLAALSACIECLGDYGGLEHAAFSERARHFTHRLESSAAAPTLARSAVLDRLFVGEAREKIDGFHAALAALPPDAYAIKSDCADLILQAEHLELWGLADLLGQLARHVASHDDLDAPGCREQALQLIGQFEAALAALPG
jgi:hypothetical protein